MNYFYLGNFSSGTAATVALNTIDVKPNESLGIKISGGTIPAVTNIVGELVKADNTKSVNSINNNTSVNDIIGIEQTRYPLVSLYETVLKVS